MPVVPVPTPRLRPLYVLCLWALLLCLLPAAHLQAALQDPCTGLEAGGNYHNQEAHAEGRYRVRRDGTRVTATLTTTSSLVPPRVLAPEPLFTFPESFRPPLSVLLGAEGTPVLADGTPDPDHPEPLRFRLRVDPDGAVHYADDLPVKDAAYLAYTLHAVWEAAPVVQEPCPVLEIRVQYLDRAEHEEGRYRLRRDGTRVTAIVTVDRSPVPARGGAAPAPLFRVPVPFRPPYPILRSAQGTPVLADGTPDPDSPELRRFLLQVEPDGHVRYADDTAVEDAEHLAYSLHTVWGTTPAANDRAVLEILDEHWFRETLLSAVLPPAQFEVPARELRQGYFRETIPAANLGAFVTFDADGRVTALGAPTRALDWSPEWDPESPIYHFHGPLLPELGQLHRLEHLDLGYRILNWGRPPEDTGALTGAIPSQLGQLARLRYLDLQGQRLVGPLPPELGHLASLEYLNLDTNRLQGFLPPELGQLPSLRHLDLSRNGLTVLPPELGQLPSLRHLDLSYNELTALPPELGQLPSLRHLDLSVNELTALPPELGQLPSLRHLDLSRNDLTALPPELDQLPSLRHLDLNGNELSALPRVLGRLPNLQHLNLYRNELTGPLPPEWSQLTNLERLSLMDNELTGPLPPEWSQLTNLEWLSLGHNQLTGPLPPAWGQLASLEFLHLGDNQLTGPLPPEWSQLASLEYLILYRNQLTGSLPPMWGQLTNLEWLYLNGNQLTGPLPPAWGQLASLEFLHLEDNQLTGPLPLEWTRLTNLYELDLRDNQLTGCYPQVYFPHLPTGIPEPRDPYVATDLPGCPLIDYIYRYRRNLG